MKHDQSYVEKDFTVIGTRVPRPDGVDKGTGRAKYGADAYAPGQLVGLVLRSPAEAMKGISVKWSNKVNSDPRSFRSCLIASRNG